MLPKIFKPYKSFRKNLVRIGPKTDGGYVIDRRVIKKSNTIITCGLNDDWEFEKNIGMEALSLRDKSAAPTHTNRSHTTLTHKFSTHSNMENI